MSIDLISRRVFAWKLGWSMGASLVIEAFNLALGHRRLERE
ncbi:hypothetical protein [Synechococcus sp. CS-1332]|nr:hypothetical protein [Synechococcus sp. CS-1332]